MKVVALAGGVGGAKLVDGLSQDIAGEFREAALFVGASHDAESLCGAYLMAALMATHVMLECGGSTDPSACRREVSDLILAVFQCP